MKFFTPTKYFERNGTAQVPRKVERIVRSCASRATSGVLTSKACELTEAMMLMKLYQAYGNESRRYSNYALELLRSMLLGTSGTSQSFDEIRGQALAKPASFVSG